MNEFKFEAYLSEFPALRQAIGKREASWCESIQIKRITPELLSKMPKEYEAVGNLVGISEGDQVYLVLGGELKKVAPYSTHRSNYAHEGTHNYPGETILEAIDREGIPDLILWIEYGLQAVEHYSTDDWRATIYKPAKDFSISDAIAEAKLKAMQEVSTEAEF